MTVILVVILIYFLLTWRWVELERVHQRELGRFIINTVEGDGLNKRIDRFFEILGRRLVRNAKSAQQARNVDRVMNEKLRQAGLEGASDHAKFALVRVLCYLCWPVIVALAWANFTTYYATVTTMFSLALIAVLPNLLLSRRTIHRRENIQRELPLVVDLTNLGTSAGWDVSVALERVIDALSPEYPGHPLINELKRAKWLAVNGYTWGEALERVSRRLSDDTVSRVTKALVQAVEQGGDRTAQLDGIAQDAQRSYYSALDKRLASVPVKSLVMTMILFLTYFVLLLAPATVGIESSFSKM